MQNEPRQVIYARPMTPKLKNDRLTWTIKAILLVALFFTQIFNGKSNFNSLFAYLIDPSLSESFAKITGMSMSQAFSMLVGGAMAASLKIIYPLIFSAIVFLLYLVYAKFFAYLVFNQFIAINLPFDIRKFRICLDTSIIFLCALMGISRLIFNYYPLASNIGMAIVDAVFAVLALGLFFFTFSRELEKKYYPVLASIMLIPAICLVVIV